MTTPAPAQHGGVLAGVKAKPFGWPAASLDTGSGHRPTAAIRGRPETRSLQIESPRKQGNLSTDAYEQWRTPFSDELGPVPERVLQARTAFFTPTVAATVRQIDQGLPRICQAISWALDYAEHGVVDPYVHTESRSSGRTELLIIDEADRLKATGLEQVRDYYDRHHMGVILIGMPGIEKRLARYPQLYSRIGFAHEYRTLGPDELTAVLDHRLPAPTEPAGDGGIARAAAIAAIVRTTGGNFRLVDRLLTQIRRIQAVNDLHALTPETVDAARETMLIGH